MYSENVNDYHMYNKNAKRLNIIYIISGRAGKMK